MSIQARFTLWYLFSPIVFLAFFATGGWFAMRAVLYQSVDRDLRHKMDGVVSFLQSNRLDSAEALRRVLGDATHGAVIGLSIEVTDDASHELYPSDLLTERAVPNLPQPEPGNNTGYTTVTSSGATFRVASRRLAVDGRALIVRVIEPLSDLLASLDALIVYLLWLIPLALLVTAATGYWISRRALAPMAHIRREVDAIDFTDLTARLHEPVHDDELGRLAQTLNSLMTRIESGFRSVTQFTADASHELRAPLAYIIAAGDIALRRQRTREELAVTISKIVVEARRMSRLVEDLLALARGDASLAIGLHEPVDLREVFRDASEQMELSASVKHLKLALALPDLLPEVMGDPSDLRRLALILLDNAINYSEHGIVAVALYVSLQEVHIRVTDTGIGIETSNLNRIFDRFWRADKARSRAEGGVGLGLSLAAQIVQRHHGSISVESALGLGSSFIVRLPALAAVPQSAPVKHQPDKHLRLNNDRML